MKLIDGIPVAQGSLSANWVSDRNDCLVCSSCGYSPAYDAAIDDFYLSPYCPECGARMKNGQSFFAEE